MKIKNALILPETGSTPEDFWFPYLVNKLQEQGWQANCPALPDTALQIWKNNCHLF